MATVNDGFIGGFRGRMGNVVGYVWRGKYCVRTLPGEFHDAKTPMQMEQRSLFRKTIRFASRARRVLMTGLHTQSVNSHLTEYNYFMRINKRCFALEDNVLQVDYENLLLSDGPVAPVAFGVPTMLDDRTISIDFEKNPLHRAVSSEDRVYLAAYCPDLEDFDLSQPAFRGDKHLEISIKPLWAGREVHLWGFVVDKHGRASISQYIGCGTLEIEEFNSNHLSSVDDDLIDDDTIDNEGITAQHTSSRRGTSHRDGKVDAPQSHTPI